MMPSATLSRMARMRSPLWRSSSSARRRSMNWPIWLPMSAITRSMARSSERPSWLKSAMTPVTFRPLVTAKANGHPPLADVVEECHELDARRRARRRGNGYLDRKLVAVTVQAGELDGLADEPTLTRLDVVSQPSLVGVAVATRNDRAGQRPPHGLIVGPAEDLLGLAVPAGDQAVRIRADNGAW